MGWSWFRTILLTVTGIACRKILFVRGIAFCKEMITGVEIHCLLFLELDYLLSEYASGLPVFLVENKMPNAQPSRDLDPFSSPV